MPKHTWEEPLMAAIEADDDALARKAIASAGPALHQRVQHGDGCHLYGSLALFDEAEESDTALHIAVRRRALKVAAALVDAGLDRDGKNFFGRTPISLYAALTPPAPPGNACDTLLRPLP